jgi:hypothetical protein
MALLAESWHIRSRARTCSATDRPFEDGETIVTALFPDPESSGYVRKDFGVAEWKARDQEVTGTPFSFWKAVYQAPVAGEKQDAFKRESPEDLLRRLVEEDEDHTENARYILAVMLERKKVLRETDTQRTPSGILRVYEHRKLGDVFIVKDPDIPLSDVERVQDEVMILLEQSSSRSVPGETEEEAPAPESPEAAEAVTVSEGAEPASDDPAPEDPATPEAAAEGEPHSGPSETPQ